MWFVSVRKRVLLRKGVACVHFLVDDIYYTILSKNRIRIKRILYFNCVFFL